MHYSLMLIRCIAINTLQHNTVSYEYVYLHVGYMLYKARITLDMLEKSSSTSSNEAKLANIFALIVIV